MRLRRRRDVRTPLPTAYHLLHVARQDDYGDPTANWEAIAAAWSLVLRDKLNADLTAREAALCMAAMKILRATKRDHLDDLADGAAYLEIAHEVTPR